ncbi:MAG: N-6 DNA methylase [bacterium]|nr:N-6 DNA methylase [bacterium]
MVRALRFGNPAWGVPAYNGALFSADDFEGAALLERLEFNDQDFAGVLLAVGRDATEGSGLDYASLEIGHLGHIYEVLLSLRLSVADRPLNYDAGADRYVPATAEAPSGEVPSHGTPTGQAAPDVSEGSLLWQTNEGGRKAGGVYYTPVSLVRHLVDRAVVPAYERHLEAVRETARTDPRRAAAELLDFSVLDPACGSAHFLVQVTEALADRAVAFLGETPLPAIREALDRLRAQARGGAAVTDVALLRRLVLKHCVFGVDLSPMGAEIATMSLWLASFVPGLSLAYLGRNVVVGNSLIGVGSAGSVADTPTRDRHPPQDHRRPPLRDGSRSDRGRRGGGDPHLRRPPRRG